MRRTGVTMMAAGLAMALGLATADAAPLVANLQPAVAQAGDASLILVRQGCGFGAHRGWYGGCRLNHGWRGAIRGRRDAWRYGYARPYPRY